MDNKSHDYTVVRLDRDPGGEWRALSAVLQDAKGTAEDKRESLPPSDAGDVAFEHRPTGTIISLNSVCREYREDSLEELSRHLLLGLNPSGLTETREVEVDGVPALESTVQASMGQRRPSGQAGPHPVRVRAVVLRKAGCTYDLMYIARPENFDGLLGSFDRFLKGFHAD